MLQLTVGTSVSGVVEEQYSDFSNNKKRKVMVSTEDLYPTNVSKIKSESKRVFSKRKNRCISSPMNGWTNLVRSGLRRSPLKKIDKLEHPYVSE